MDEKLRLKYFFQTENVLFYNCTATLLLNEEKAKKTQQFVDRKPEKRSVMKLINPHGVFVYVLFVQSSNDNYD